MNERKTKLEALFHAAMNLASSEERKRYLAEACAGDPELRREVDGLLKSAEEADAVFQAGRDACRVPEASSTAVVVEKPGDRIGRYKLLQPIGEGGCGVVYMAEQEEPVRRRVALKIIKLGMDTKQVVARFEAERQALALMDHPNIAKVFDAGATASGRPYFVMELVRGIKITTYADDNHLSTAVRLDLFMQVCKAVQHAHQKGIIHRDLKPSNILVADHDGVPVPKIIDFGIAKATTDQRLTDKTVFTAFEQFIGTPAYMSPEQARFSGLDVDTRTDIYSLGVLLYELLTGRTPLDEQELLAAGLEEMRRRIREVDPPRPSTRLCTMAGETLTTTARHRHVEAPKLIHQIRGDLDWIVMKCLEKDRNRRYETANGLAADIQRHLNHEPVVACPPSRLYEFQKSVRRHKLGFTAASAVALALVIGLGTSAVLLVKERKARESAVAAELAAETARGNESAQRQQAQEERARAETAEKKAEGEAARSAQEARFMRDMLKGVGPAVALGRDTKLLREILDQTARRLKTDLAGNPEVEADLRETLGVVYRDLADYTNAVAMLQESLRLRSNSLGSSNAAVASSLHDLAEALRLQWKNREAAAMFREALAIRTNLNQPLVMAASMFGLAETLRRDGVGRFEAEKLHSETLAIRRQWLGKHEDTAMSLVGLGITLRDGFSKLQEAESHQTEAVIMLRELYGDVHPKLAYALYNLGGTLVRMPGRLTDAETNLLQALAIQRKLFAADHNDTGQTLAFLGDTYVQQGRLSEAERMYRQRVQIFTRIGRRPAPQMDLANVLLLQGKPEAEAALREALEILKASEFTQGSASYLPFLKLISLLFHQGMRSEAEALIREVEAIDTAAAQNALAWYLATWADPEERDGRRAVYHAEKAVVATNRKDGGYLDTLAAAYALVGDFTNAVGFQHEALAILGPSAPKDFEFRLKRYRSNEAYVDHVNLGGTVSSLLAIGKFAAAEPLARDCVWILEKEQPDGPDLFKARSLLGRALLGQGKYAEAEPLLLSCHESLKSQTNSVPAASQGMLKEVLQSLVQLYEATGHAEARDEWRRKLTGLAP